MKKKIENQIHKKFKLFSSSKVFPQKPLRQKKVNPELKCPSINQLRIEKTKYYEKQ